MIPIDLASFEWNPKCLILDSSGACASGTGEESLGNSSFFHSYPMPKHLVFFLFLPPLPLQLAWLWMAHAGKSQTISLWILADLSVPFLLHFPHWEIPTLTDLRFKHSSGVPSSQPRCWFLAGPFSNTLFQAHHVPIATPGNNWDALRSLSVLLALDYKCSCQQVNLKWIRQTITQLVAGPRSLLPQEAMELKK